MTAPWASWEVSIAPAHVWLCLIFTELCQVFGALLLYIGASMLLIAPTDVCQCCSADG